MLTFDAQHYPYASRRNVVYAKHGMVATAQPLAAQADLRVLQAGAMRLMRRWQLQRPCQS